MLVSISAVNAKSIFSKASKEADSASQTEATAASLAVQTQPKLDAPLSEDAVKVTLSKESQATAPVVANASAAPVAAKAIESTNETAEPEEAKKADPAEEEAEPLPSDEHKSGAVFFDEEDAFHLVSNTAPSAPHEFHVTTKDSEKPISGSNQDFTGYDQHGAGSNPHDNPANQEKQPQQQSLNTYA